MATKNNTATTLTGETDGLTWTYTGGVRNGMRHGKGKCTWSDGDVYEGDWVDDKQNGKGKYTYDDGDVYEGDWVDGKAHGKGKKTTTNGHVYEGDWYDGKYSEPKKRSREEEERLFKYAWDNNKCPLCNRPISCEEKSWRKVSDGVTLSSRTFRHPYCQSCGWKSSLASSSSTSCDRFSFGIEDWEKAEKECREHGVY